MNHKLKLILLSTIVAVTCIQVNAQEQTGTGQQPGGDKISKDLLINLSREQSYLLCESEVFTSCMGFDKQTCFDLSEEAVQQCLAPLPDTIKIAELQNESLEACPQEVYAKAGYTDAKAQECLQEALQEK